MARKESNTVEYFPHDSWSSDGDTLTVLEERFGNDGYAFWFKLLEKLARTEGHFIDCNDKGKWEVLCAKAHTTPENGITIVEILADLKTIDPELWKSRVIWCQHLVDNLADVYRNRKRNLPSKPITTPNNPLSTSSNIPTDGISTPDNQQSKVKESKVKESKVKESKEEVATTSDKNNKIKSDNLYPEKKEEQSPELTAVVDAFVRCGGVVASQMVALELAEAEREYGADIVIAAFRRAASNGKSGVRLLSYCRPIFEDYKQNGIKDDKGSKFKDSTEERWKLPDDFITEGTRLDTAIEIAEGRKEANKANFKRICDELDRRGVKYNKKEFNASQ